LQPSKGVHDQKRGDRKEQVAELVMVGDEPDERRIPRQIGWGDGKVGRGGLMRERESGVDGDTLLVWVSRLEIGTGHFLREIRIVLKCVNHLFAPLDLLVE